MLSLSGGGLCQKRGLCQERVSLSGGISIKKGSLSGGGSFSGGGLYKKRPTSPYGRRAGSTHPTRILSCSENDITNKQIV